MENTEIIEFNGEIDLHHFSAMDIPLLLDAVIEEARSKKLLSIKIIHGKGQSFKKKCVIDYLTTCGRIKTYDDDSHNWGATVADLK